MTRRQHWDALFRLETEVVRLRLEGVELVTGMAMLLGQLPADRRKKLPKLAPDLCVLIERFGVEAWPWATPSRRGRPLKQGPSGEYGPTSKRRLQQLKQQSRKG
jgi:hypothetical protein